ncbi:g7356 [Coccomyxa viridis]|uniref:G7356 protein n=1 Tax=Coccomyxa viridis TaxID=1274662 RepID=A0ABP1G2H6_9CHLO
MQRSDSGGTPASMPADSSPQPLPARSIDGRQEQHAQRKIAEAARVAHRPFRPPLKILQRSSRDERMPSQKVLGVVQRPGSHQQQGWAPATDQPTHIPLSHMQIGHVPLPPTDPVPSAPYMPAPGNQQSPAPGPFQQHRPQPQEGFHGDRQGSVAPRQAPPVKAGHCTKGRLAPPNTHSSSNSGLAAGLACPSGKPSLRCGDSPVRPPFAPSDPEEAVANPLAGMRLDGVWGQPVPSAVRAPPQPPVQLIRPPPSQANTASSQPNHAVPPEKHQESLKIPKADDVRSSAKAHGGQGDPVLCALANLFSSAGQHLPRNICDRTLDPIELRLALAEQYPQLFPKGLREQAFRMQKNGGQASLQASAVMRELEKRISIKRCNEDEGGCGHPASMQQTLKGQQPLAFLIQLGWDLKATGKHMRGTMELFREGIDLGELFLGVKAGRRHYLLSIMVCFYGCRNSGGHYSAFVHKKGQWWVINDTTSEAVGSWAELLHKIEHGKTQPLVLFFEPT